MSSSPHSRSLCCCRSLSASGGRCTAPPSERCPLVDVASASNHAHFHLRHLHLDLQINFAVKEMSGWLVLDLSPLRSGVQTLVLDSHPSVLVRSVDLKDPERAQDPPQSLVFTSEGFSEFGSALKVVLPELRAGREVQVTIRYSTTDGPAVWWLDPELTCGQTRPLVFTQGHCVCNRSFFPCFDTPAVKSPYSATIRVPDGFTVLMSASRSSFCREERVFQFWMDEPVPSYLVALVCGELQHHDLGPRSRVWAEPCLLSCAVQKLGGSVERWLSVAERLFGPYLWGRCDVVFLPPSFPIVAMENPCLTFIISSILESSEFLLIDVIHEIAHGWFGNAVTNATWEEMWLSEGLATYAQRRITTEAYGEAFTCLETVVRLDALHRQLRLLGDNSPVSKLHVPLEPGVNPSSLMNLFTYEKGFCFVSYLCELSGDRERFDAFLREYICEFKFKSVVAQDLIVCFLQHFPELQSAPSRTGLEFERWLTACGAPLFEPDLSVGGALTQPVYDLLRLWSDPARPPDPHSLAPFDLSSWSTFQIVLFLDRLLDLAPLTHELMSRLSSCYSALFAALNAEVQIRWLQLVVRSLFYPELPRVRDFLHKHTSRMYTVPLYEDMASGVMRSNAAEYFSQSQRRLHPNLRRSLQALLLPNQSAAAAGGGEANQSTAAGGEEANHNSPLAVRQNSEETNQNGGSLVIQNGGQTNQNVWTQNGGQAKVNGAAPNQNAETPNRTANHRAAACHSPEARTNQGAAFFTQTDTELSNQIAANASSSQGTNQNVAQTQTANHSAAPSQMPRPSSPFVHWSQKQSVTLTEL
ncbi:aminopeptidase RNPEPL1 [Boleophthalmus pectinirostris]|uniref:aminopeptidase RNPEPL1 n=1 Tax=Boleophthalmus pectinirostris TaxID=150288 RepID=UPI00242C22B3|nr:aminopeptidase RNPEPL1 [Boleophthalmus pectinirostris]